MGESSRYVSRSLSLERAAPAGPAGRGLEQGFIMGQGFDREPGKGLTGGKKKKNEKTQRPKEGPAPAPDGSHTANFQSLCHHTIIGGLPLGSRLASSFRAEGPWLKLHLLGQLKAHEGVCIFASGQSACGLGTAPHPWFNFPYIGYLRFVQGEGLYLERKSGRHIHKEVGIFRIHAVEENFFNFMGLQSCLDVQGK